RRLGSPSGRAMRESRRQSADLESPIRSNPEIDEVAPPPSPTSHPAPLETPTPAVEAAVPDSTLDPLAPATAATAVEVPPGEAFVAQRGARLFHTRDCGWVRRVGEPERVYFKHVAGARGGALTARAACAP